MSETSNDDGRLRAGAPTGPTRRTELLRAAADQELSAADEQALRDHFAAHPEDRQVLALEQQLRSSIATVFDAAAPPNLKQRIERLRIEGEPSGEDARPSLTRPTVGRPLFAGRPLRWLAVAASIALIGGIGYVALREPGAAPRQGEAIHPAYRVSLTSFVGDHHRDCELSIETASREFSFTALDEAPGALQRVLGGRPDVSGLAAAGLKFVGGGPCAVPGRGRSVHLVFEADAPFQETGPEGGAGAPVVSVFIQQDSGALDIEPGRTYSLVAKEAASGEAPSVDIYVWRRDGMVYFLASSWEPAMETALAVLKADEPSGTL